MQQAWRRKYVQNFSSESAEGRALRNVALYGTIKMKFMLMKYSVKMCTVSI
jgi:hypothetical protein